MDQRGEVEMSLACDNDGTINVRCDLKLFEGSIVEKRARTLRRTEQLAFDVKPGETEQRIGTAVYALKKDRMELKSGLQVDVRVGPPHSFGAALVYFSGSKQHNICPSVRVVSTPHRAHTA